jgi:phosphomannomutase / phosphoglucomutase
VRGAKIPQRRVNKPHAAAGKESGKQGRTHERLRSLASFWVSAFLGIALILLLATLGVLYAWMAEGHADRTRDLGQASRFVVTNLGRRVAALRDQIEALATDPSLRAALRSGKPEVFRAAEQKLAAQLPQATGIRLLPTGYGAVDAKTDTLSYAALDLVHQAEQRRKVTELEVHRLGYPDVHVAIAGPVLDEAGTSALGALYVALPLSWLPTLPSQDSAAGRLGFQQVVDDLAVTLNTERGRAISAPVPDVTEAVPNTRLRVAGWVPNAAFPPAARLAYAGAGYGLILALIAAVLWLAWAALKKAVASDQAAVVALTEDAAARRPLRQPDCCLAETRPVLEVLRRLLRGLEPGGPARASSGAVAAEPESMPAAPPAAEARAGAESGPGMPRQRGAPAASSQPKPPQAKAVAAPKALPRLAPPDVPAAVFRKYDIRGVVGGGGLTPALMRAIGCAVGTAAGEAGNQTVTVARDTRPSSLELSQALVDGLRTSGRDVVDLGVGPTPLLYFATSYQGLASGAMVTGSHNPSDYNGLKVVIGGRNLESDGIRGLRDRILTGRFSHGEGALQEADLTVSYMDRVEKDVAVAYTMKVVVDCGNGAASVLAPRLYRSLGCDVVPIDCDPAAGFPRGRVPDPANPASLEALQQRVVHEKADLGLAFDTDGDRLGVVDSSGKIIWTDRVLMLLAADVLSRHPGTDVVFDVKCTHHLPGQILKNGGRPVMWRSGYAPVKAKLLETGGLLGGEWSGHIMFRERWYGFDDAIYAGARLLEVLALDPRPSAEVFAALPDAISTPELFLPLAEGGAGPIMEAVMEYADRLEGVGVQTIDGLRADSEHGWGLVRASNTQPALVFRFEGDDESALNQVKDLFRRLMGRAAPDLALPF